MAGEEKARREQPQNMILESRRRLSVSGVEEVLAFDEHEVSMKTVLGELTVKGEELKVEKLEVESGELHIQGKISELSYQETPPTLWERLFG